MSKRFRHRYISSFSWQLQDIYCFSSCPSFQHTCNAPQQVPRNIGFLDHFGALARGPFWHLHITYLFLVTLDLFSNGPGLEGIISTACSTGVCAHRRSYKAWGSKHWYFCQVCLLLQLSTKVSKWCTAFDLPWDNPWIQAGRCCSVELQAPLLRISCSVPSGFEIKVGKNKRKSLRSFHLHRKVERIAGVAARVVVSSHIRGWFPRGIGGS